MPLELAKAEFELATNGSRVIQSLRVRFGQLRGPKYNCTALVNARYYVVVLRLAREDDMDAQCIDAGSQRPDVNVVNL